MRKSRKRPCLKGLCALSGTVADEVQTAPKAGALPTALHPVIELFYPAGRILPKRARRQLRCTRRCPTTPIIAELRLSFKLFFGQPTFLEKQNFLSKACYRRAEM